jgi:FG-GAP repeat
MLFPRHTYGPLASFWHKSKRSNRHCPSAPTIRPSLELLEHRWLPSILTVTSSLDHGTGTLRGALAAAHSGDTISFAFPNPRTIQLEQAGTLHVAAGVNILGPGSSELTIKGNGGSSDFLVSGSGDTTISGLTITGGGGSGGGIDTGGIAMSLTLNNDVITGNHAGTQGGGIQNTGGGLFVTNCTVSGNFAGVAGGGVYSGLGTLITITGSTITGNTVTAQNQTDTGGGGGIWNDGFLTLINSTISDNSVEGLAGTGTTTGNNADGGGLLSLSDGSYTIIGCTFFDNAAEGGAAINGDGGTGVGGGARLATSGTITNCTFNDNFASGGNSTSGVGGNGAGGGIEWLPNASPTLINCTIVGNEATGRESFGGGIDDSDTGTVENSIIASNTASTSGPDINDNLTTALGDMVGNGSGSNVTVVGGHNQVGTAQSPINPQLGPLQDNGGPTETMMPLANSTAIDAGDNVLLQSAFDQRGDLRVVDGTVDMGAVEVQQFRRIAVGPGAGMPPEVKVYDPVNGILKLDFMAYESTFTGGVRVAVADMNGDGVPDVITAPAGVQVTLVNVNGALEPSFNLSLGRAPEIKVFSGVDGTKIADFLAYPSNFTAGVFVAVADVNHDGIPDIITAPDATGQSGHTNVRAFFGNHLINSGAALPPDLEFNAYDPGFGGGVRVAAADLNGDGFADIVTGPGIWSGPDVRIFDGKTLTNNHTASKIGEFLAYDPRYFGGVFVSTGDTNGDRLTDVITGTNGNGGPEVKAFSGANVLSSPTPTIIDDFFAYAPAFNGGASVAALDVNGDGKADIITGAGPGGGPHVRIFDGGTSLQLEGNTSDSFYAYDAIFSGGVYVGAG